MIPSRRVYLLLLLGMAIALVLAAVWNLLVSLTGILIFDGVVLGLMILDGLRVRPHCVELARQLRGDCPLGGITLLCYQ